MLITTSLFAKDIIAVLDLETIGLTPEEAQILTQGLTTKLIFLDKFQVVERTNMDKILKEQKFQQSGCTDSECAVEIGQLLNTDFIVIGSVNKFGSTYALYARLIDVAQGKSLISAEFSIEGKIDVLLTSGITAIANQLCGLQYTKTQIIDTENQNLFTDSKEFNKTDSLNIQSALKWGQFIIIWKINGKVVSLNKLIKVLKKDNRTHVELALRNKYFVPTLVFSTIGTFGLLMGGDDFVINPEGEGVMPRFIISLTAYIYSLYCNGKSNKHLENAVNIYNE